MIPVVFDCGVVMAGVGWRSEPHLCLSTAGRQCLPFVTADILAEYERTMKRMEAENFFKQSPWPLFHWFTAKCLTVDPAPLGKQRSRDPKDDPYLACALAARARFIISRDPDLLDLGKPFGVEIVTPRAFLSRLTKPI
ncbi:MAG TPA: putative toxin-antitoxin system toxin component, PIN family [Verrucomicrobiae bacterium]